MSRFLVAALAAVLLLVSGDPQERMYVPIAASAPETAEGFLARHRRWRASQSECAEALRRLGLLRAETIRKWLPFARAARGFGPRAEQRLSERLAEVENVCAVPGARGFQEMDTLHRELDAASLRLGAEGLSSLRRETGISCSHGWAVALDAIEGGGRAAPAAAEAIGLLGYRPARGTPGRRGRRRLRPGAPLPSVDILRELVCSAQPDER